MKLSTKPKSDHLVFFEAEVEVGFLVLVGFDFLRYYPDHYYCLDSLGLD